MQGIIRAVARVAVMGVVMAAVLTVAVLAGVAPTTGIALGLVLAGIVGLIGYVRRPRDAAGAATIEAMLAADPLTKAAAPKLALAAVESLAPNAVAAEVDPEANMPRWRRPSLLEARRSDPTRVAPSHRLPMRFTGEWDEEIDVRTVRYAVVPVLDRPDEILGLRVSDVGSGDEVQVVASSGGFLEVVCPNGDRGWVHRTTLGQRGPAGMTGQLREAANQEADDAMTALLTARGLT